MRLFLAFYLSVLSHSLRIPRLLGTKFLFAARSNHRVLVSLSRESLVDGLLVRFRHGARIATD